PLDIQKRRRAPYVAAVCPCPAPRRAPLRRVSPSRRLALTIENHLQWCPEFLNVVNLTLGQWCLDSNFYALIVFLQNSPRLQKLTLKLEKSNMRISRRIIGELTEISFTCEHLNTVEVICSENDPQVITVQDFFVSSGMTSVQFHIKHWSPYANDLPAFIRSI
ncbi:Os10g0127900, partial [Oryza sativa Japonica Group]